MTVAFSSQAISVMTSLHSEWDFTAVVALPCLLWTVGEIGHYSSLFRWRSEWIFNLVHSQETPGNTLVCQRDNGKILALQKVCKLVILSPFLLKPIRKDQYHLSASPRDKSRDTVHCCDCQLLRITHDLRNLVFSGLCFIIHSWTYKNVTRYVRWRNHS